MYIKCVFFFRGVLGLIKVDFNHTERTRTPKASYVFYKNVISTKQLAVDKTNTIV